MVDDTQIALTLLQLIALLFPAVGLVLEALAAAHADRSGAIWGRRTFVFLQVSFVALSLAAVVVFWFLATTRISVMLLVSMVFVIGAMTLLSLALFVMSGFSLYQMIEKLLGKR